MNTCRHCQDRFASYRCPMCNKVIKDACRECHGELKHDLVSESTSQTARPRTRADVSRLLYGESNE